ncbi:MAG: M14 family metallopeptidase, partial [Myxococcota bacterium]
MQTFRRLWVLPLIVAGFVWKAQAAPRQILAWDSVHRELERLHAEHPDRTRLFQIGESALGKPLLALKVASNPDDRSQPAILLSGGQHGNEAATPLHVLDAARMLLDEPETLSGLAFVLVPMVNPDGNEGFLLGRRGGGRKNGRRVSANQTAIGVDLNRNYPFGWGTKKTRFTSAAPNSRFFQGPAAASEPEVRAIMELAERERFVASISYHSAATKIIVPYSTPGATDAQPSLPWDVAEAMLARLPHRFGQKRYRATRGLYPVTGNEKDWLYHRFGTMAYVVELPYRRPQGERLAESIEHSRGTWRALVERFVSGPSLSIRAQSADGAPLEAQIEIIDGAATRMIHETLSNTGWYHGYVPSGPL